MGVDTTWTSPAAGGVLDLATGGTVTETVWDAIVSDLLHLGGTAGYVPAAALAANAATMAGWVVLDADVQTNSLSYVDVHATKAGVTITTVGGPVKVMWVGPVTASAGGAGAVLFCINVDGVDSLRLGYVRAPFNDLPTTITYWCTPAAGTHTFKLRYTVLSGTGVIPAGTTAYAYMSAIEFRR